MSKSEYKSKTKTKKYIGDTLDQLMNSHGLCLYSENIKVWSGGNTGCYHLQVNYKVFDSNRNLVAVAHYYFNRSFKSFNPSGLIRRGGGRYAAYESLIQKLRKIFKTPIATALNP